MNKRTAPIKIGQKNPTTSKNLEQIEQAEYLRCLFHYDLIWMQKNTKAMPVYVSVWLLFLVARPEKSFVENAYEMKRLQALF